MFRSNYKINQTNNNLVIVNGFDVMELEMIESTNKVISFFCLPLPGNGAAWGCRKL